MKNAFLFLVTLILFGCGHRNPKPKPPRAKDTTTASAKPIEDVYDPNAPNIDTLRKRLFAYFDTHRNLDTFSYYDDTYSKYWGPSMYPAYYIQAGHLFNKAQLHAMVCYCDERSAGMRIYLKKNSIWRKIYEDTTLNNGGGGYALELKDWNSDGMPDICLNEKGPTDEVQTYMLWLMDKRGTAVHYVDKFESVTNPEIDSRNDHIVSWYVHNVGMTRCEYQFDRYTLKEILCVSVGETAEHSRDSSGCVHYYRNDKTIKEIYCDIDSVSKYVPREMKKNVGDYFGN